MASTGLGISSALSQPWLKSSSQRSAKRAACGDSSRTRPEAPELPQSAALTPWLENKVTQRWGSEMQRRRQTAGVFCWLGEELLSTEHLWLGFYAAAARLSLGFDLLCVLCSFDQTGFIFLSGVAEYSAFKQRLDHRGVLEMTEQTAKIILEQYFEDGEFTALKLCFDFFGKPGKRESRLSPEGSLALLLSLSNLFFLSLWWGVGLSQPRQSIVRLHVTISLAVIRWKRILRIKISSQSHFWDRTAHQPPARQERFK